MKGGTREGPTGEVRAEGDFPLRIHRREPGKSQAEGTRFRPESAETGIHLVMGRLRLGVWFPGGCLGLPLLGAACRVWVHTSQWVRVGVRQLTVNRCQPSWASDGCLAWLGMSPQKRRTEQDSLAEGRGGSPGTASLQAVKCSVRAGGGGIPKHAEQMMWWEV